MCVYSCPSYPAWKLHLFCAEFYCYLLPLWLTEIVPNHLTNGTIFGKTLLNIKCEFWFSLQIMSETFIILRRIQRDMYTHLHVRYTSFFLYFNPIRIFSTNFKKVVKYQISRKSIQWRPSCSMRTELILAFRNFSKAPKAAIYSVECCNDQRILK